MEVPIGKKKLGINVSDDDGPSFITKVVKNSTAEKLGICVGMQVLKVSGTDCTDSSQNMVLSLLAIRPVVIELLRPEGDDTPSEGFAGGETPDQLAVNTARASQDDGSGKAKPRASLFGGAAARLKEKAMKAAAVGKKKPEEKEVEDDDEEEVDQEEDIVYAKAWFIKKGKSDARDDRRKRFCQLVGPRAVIKYYVAVDDQGNGTKQRGAIDLEDGFNFWNEEGTLFIDTPNRLWTLVLDGEDWQGTMDEWLRHLKEFREGNCLEWERPEEGADALPFTDEIGEPTEEAGMETFPIDTRVPLGTPVPGELKGWFRKKGKSEKLADFTRRFHVLDEAACGIHYYKGVKDGEAVSKKGTIDLSAGYEVVRTTAADKTNSRLQIITPTRTWILIAEDGYRDNKVLEAKIWQRMLMEKRGTLVPELAGADVSATLAEVPEEDDATEESTETTNEESKPAPKAVPARPKMPSRPPRPSASSEPVPELTAEEEAAERMAARQDSADADEDEVDQAGA